LVHTYSCGCHTAACISVASYVRIGLMHGHDRQSFFSGGCGAMAVSVLLLGVV
jgi:hypothetical protein